MPVQAGEPPMVLVLQIAAIAEAQHLRAPALPPQAKALCEDA